jgi:O-6-methylguanine DNA methyltransferase
MDKIFFGNFEMNGMSVYAAATELGICRLDFSREKDFFDWIKKNFKEYELVHDESKFLQVKEELEAYFKKEKRNFDIEMDLIGTKFQKEVWNQLTKIPYGKTVCYEDIAVAVGGKNYCRAVGGAINKNPVIILVPCHRVIGKDGSLVGFAGGIDLKKKLLELEK